jgi:hypothetical protein
MTPRQKGEEKIAAKRRKKSQKEAELTEDHKGHEDRFEQKVAKLRWENAAVH